MISDPAHVESGEIKWDVHGLQDDTEDNKVNKEVDKEVDDELFHDKIPLDARQWISIKRK